MTPDLDALREYYDTNDTADQLANATLETPDPVTEPMVTYALRLPKPIMDQLRSTAEAAGMRVSALMRAWLEERLVHQMADEDRTVQIDIADLLSFIPEHDRTPGRRRGNIPPMSRAG